MGSSRKTSRVITGFHRLGLVLAVPLLLGALGTAISAWFSNDGPYVPDPKATLPAQIILKSQATNPRDMTDDELRLLVAYKTILETKANSFARIEVDTGPHRTFALYQIYQNPSVQQQGNPVIKANDPLIDTLIDSIAQFEKKRGTVLLATEQPVLIGNILAQEDAAARYYSYRSWTHLVRGFDWQRIALAGAIAAFAVFIYIVALALGWVIDGFISRTEG